jgi:hypothetical protein
MNVDIGNLGNDLGNRGSRGSAAGLSSSLSNKGRWASALGGGALLTLAARRRSPLSIPLALGGAALILRGLTGHRSFRAAFEQAMEAAQATERGGREEPATSPEVGEVDPAEDFNRNVGREPWERERDPVQEASEESFPASDPPSFSPTAIG